MDPIGHIPTGIAVRTILRAMKYSLKFRWELLVKATTQATSIFWILFLPLPLKLVIDYIVVRDISTVTDVNVPFFYLPLLQIIEGMEAYEVASFIGVIFLLMIVLIGAYGVDGAQRDSAVARLSEGEDVATRSENAANDMHSLVSGLFGLFESLWHVRVTHRLNHSLRSEIFNRFKAHRLTDYSDQSIGDVVFRAMYDTPAISSIIFNLWVGPLTSAVNLITTILVMYVVFREEPVVVWGAIMVGPLNFFLVLYFAKLSRKYGTLAREAGAATTAVIEEGINNTLAVQGLGSESTYQTKFRETSEFSFHRFRQLVLVGIGGSYVSFVIGVNMIYIVFYFLAHPFIQETYSPGDWILIWSYYGAISASTTYLGRLWLTLQESVAGMHRVFTILDTDVENVDEIEFGDSSSSRFQEITGGISLREVNYTYPDGTQAIRNVTFEGNLGELIAITGPTGSGKTTLSYLIPGLLVPTSGDYLVDDRKTTSDDLASLRNQVAFVFQETSIFNDTVEGNIRMGRMDASMEDIQQAALVAGAEEFISRLPEGYATNLGKSGAKLSVGQKQRLAIARALVSDKPILILDEPTAALDPQTENLLVQRLQEIREQRLVIVVAHRLSTIRAADRIYFMNEGEIAESGSHSELMNQDGMYAEFVRLQSELVA